MISSTTLIRKEVIQVEAMLDKGFTNHLLAKAYENRRHKLLKALLICQLKEFDNVRRTRSRNHN